MTLPPVRRLAIDAASFGLWMIGWLTVGYDRPVRVAVAMVLVLLSSRLMDRGIRLSLTELQEPPS